MTKTEPTGNAIEKAGAESADRGVGVAGTHHAVTPAGKSVPYSSTNTPPLSFPGLDETALKNPPHKKGRICIVTQDIVGPIRNGGIGTAYRYAAEFLTNQGHDVTILYALGDHSEIGTIEDWVKTYADLGIAFVPMPPPKILGPQRPPWNATKLAYGVYEWLKHQDFDLVHVSEWRGLAYYAMLAKKQGLHFQRTDFVVKCSSPTMWHRIGGYEHPNGLGEVVITYMERCSVELADHVISGSCHLLNWMRDHGYNIPQKNCYVQPNIMPDILMGDGDSQEPQHAKVTEVVFFGRLESRKGIDLFCKAIDRIAKSGPKPRKVFFLGKKGKAFPADKLISEHAKSWPFEHEIIDGYGQQEALAFLRKSGRLAVIPSILENSSFAVYECISERIPFIASNTGGTPELVFDGDRNEVLFGLTPVKIAKKIQTALSDGIVVGRSAFDFRKNDDIWKRWHLSVLNEIAVRPKPSAEKSRPLVSVCLVHFNRPEMLRRAIDSLIAQTYPDVEVVLVDDGSDQPAAIEMLEHLKTEFAQRNWQVIIQENQYLGAARNTAAARATGEYILFMDDDNIAKPNEIECFIDAALASGADVLTCFADVFSSDEATADGPSDVSHRTLPVGACIPYGLFRNGFGDANALFRKSVFDAIGGFTEDYGVPQEDHELFAKVVLAGYSLQVVPEALFWYRHTEDSMMRGQTNARQGKLRVARSFVKYTSPILEQLYYYAQSAELMREDRARELKTARQDRATVKQELRVAYKKLGAADIEQKKLQHKADAASAELEAIRGSTIWRFFQPLRDLRSAMKRFKRG